MLKLHEIEHTQVMTYWHKKIVATVKFNNTIMVFVHLSMSMGEDSVHFYEIDFQKPVDIFLSSSV